MEAALNASMRRISHEFFSYPFVYFVVQKITTVIQKLTHYPEFMFI